MRRLVTLIRHLPEDSCVSRRLHGWTWSELLAVSTLEAVSELTRVELRAAGAKGDLGPPLRIPRPETWQPASTPRHQPRRRRPATATEITALLNSGTSVPGRIVRSPSDG